MLKEKSLLWTVVEPQSNTLSYVYGTMHVQSSAAFSHIESIKEAIRSKPYFYSETNLDQLALMSQDQSLFVIPNNQFLTDLVSKNKFDRWTSTAQKHFGLNLNQFKRSLPFFTTQYLQSYYLSKEHSLPLDKYLWEFAKAEERMLDGIESVEFQANVLKQIPISYQVKMLKDFLANPNKYKKMTEALSKAYESQDIHKLHRVTNASLGSLRKIMLKDRNQRMASFIFDNKKVPSVYTFGAAHLAGRFGVLAELKRKGLEVKSMRIKVS